MICIKELAHWVYVLLIRLTVRRSTFYVSRSVLTVFHTLNGRGGGVRQPLLCADMDTIYSYADLKHNTLNLHGIRLMRKICCMFWTLALNHTKVEETVVAVEPAACIWTQIAPNMTHGTVREHPTHDSNGILESVPWLIRKGLN